MDTVWLLFSIVASLNTVHSASSFSHPLYCLYIISASKFINFLRTAMMRLGLSIMVPHCGSSYGNLSRPAVDYGNSPGLR